MNEDSPLTVAVKDGVLTIAIGVNTLAHAAKHGPAAEVLDGGIVFDEGVFAEDVVAEMEAEREDGSTSVQRLLDAAMIAAIEAGSVAIL